MQVIHILLNCPFSCKLNNIRLHVIRIHEKMASAIYTYLTEHVIFISHTILISMCFGYFFFPNVTRSINRIERSVQY